jgi:ubiquinol-cytochrome c reductase iron-sulfur subunit
VANSDTSTDPSALSDDDPSRRDVILIGAGAFAAIGAAAVLWPLLDQMNPDASALSMASTSVDVSHLDEGQAITVMWRGKPIFIRNRAAPDKLPWLVMIGICTHLGCIPKGQAVGDYKGEYHGWFCPCHGSQYDTAGRIRKGPAPQNLHIPPYKFTSDTKIKIG